MRQPLPMPNMLNMLLPICCLDPDIVAKSLSFKSKSKELFGTIKNHQGGGNPFGRPPYFKTSEEMAGVGGGRGGGEFSHQQGKLRQDYVKTKLLCKSWEKLTSNPIVLDIV